MLRMQRAAFALFIAVLLLAAPSAMADTGSQDSDTSLLQSTSQFIASLNAQFSAEEGTEAQTRQQPGSIGNVSASAEAFCTRAIDIEGAFCFLSCPEGCNCEVETFFSECCCNVN